MVSVKKIPNYSIRFFLSSKVKTSRRQNILRKPAVWWGGEAPSLCSQVVVRDSGNNLHSRTGTNESGVNSNFKWDKTKGGFWVCLVTGRPRDFCGVHNSHLSALFALHARLPLDAHQSWLRKNVVLWELRCGQDKNLTSISALHHHSCIRFAF